MIGRQYYVPPVILEAKLTEEQKKWPRVSLNPPTSDPPPPEA